MSSAMRELYDQLQDLAWEFGPQGFNNSSSGGLSYVEFIALKRIYYTKDIPVQGLADSLGMTKGGISKIIDRLEQKGCAVREKNTEDGRVCCITSTAAGKEILESVLDHYAGYLDDVLSQADSEEIDVIRKGAAYLAAAIAKKEGSHACTC